MDVVLSEHARDQIKARKINLQTVWHVVADPQQRVLVDDKKTIYQSVLPDELGENYLYRVFVNIAKDPNLIITVYRTSKIQKYWNNES